MMSYMIQQSVDFPGVTASELFKTYLTSKRHSAAVGAPATISDQVGAPFKVFGDDGLRGQNLAVVPDRMVVQSWRGRIWGQDDLDSVLTLLFENTETGARIGLTHANLP